MYRMRHAYRFAFSLRFENNPRTKSEATWRWNSDYHGSRWIVDAVGAVCKNLKHLESRMLPWTSWKIPIAMRCWPTKRYHTVYTWYQLNSAQNGRRSNRKHTTREFDFTCGESRRPASSANILKFILSWSSGFSFCIPCVRDNGTLRSTINTEFILQ